MKSYHFYKAQCIVEKHQSIESTEEMAEQLFYINLYKSGKRVEKKNEQKQIADASI